MARRISAVTCSATDRGPTRRRGESGADATKPPPIRSQSISSIAPLLALSREVIPDDCAASRTTSAPASAPTTAHHRSPSNGRGTPRVVIETPVPSSHGLSISVHNSRSPPDQRRQPTDAGRPGCQISRSPGSPAARPCFGTSRLTASAQRPRPLSYLDEGVALHRPMTTFQPHCERPLKGGHVVLAVLEPSRSRTITPGASRHRAIRCDRFRNVASDA